MPTINFDFVKGVLNWLMPPRPPAPPDRIFPVIEPTPVREGPIVDMPRTFEEAVDFVAANIQRDTIDHPMFHHTGGMAMRNGLGLWNKESPLARHMVQRFGLCHADDTGMLISHAAHARVNGTVYDIDADVRMCKEHWRRYGFDPATMERLDEVQSRS